MTAHHTGLSYPTTHLWQIRKNSTPLHPLCACLEMASNNPSILAMPLLAAAQVNPVLDKARTTGHISLGISYSFMYKYFKMYACVSDGQHS